MYPLILLANRDEFYDRPTAPAARWKDQPEIYAGRDLVAGGTWLGASDDGRFAAVTNYREPGAARGELSRGKLVTDFLLSSDKPSEYLESIKDGTMWYAGFNLIVGQMKPDTSEVCYFSNRGKAIERLGSAIYGLSNHLLNTAWPKVTSGIQRFTELVTKSEISHEDCFELLADETLASDEVLPDTGVGIERERVLSPIFIRTPDYGTRSSTVLLIDNNFKLEFDEKVFV